MPPPNNADRSSLAVDLIRHRRDAANAERSANARANIKQAMRSLPPNHAITSIAGQELTTTPRRKTAIMNAPTAPTNPAASDLDKLAKIASILGVSAEDRDALEAAFVTLINGTPTADAAAATRQLSARELAMCASKKLSPAAYLAARAKLKSGGR